MGLVVHGMAGFDRGKARATLGPDDYEVEAMVAVGHPGDPADLPPELQAQKALRPEGGERAYPRGTVRVLIREDSRLCHPSSHFQPLLAGSVGERHTNTVRRVGADRDFTFTTIRGDRIGNSFVAQGRHPGQDGPKDRLRKRYLGQFLWLGSERTNATSIGLPIELKSLFSAQVQQIIDQTDNTALGRLERPLNSPWEWRQVIHGTLRISLEMVDQAAINSSKPAPGSN